MPNTAGQSGQTYFDSPIFNGPTPHEGPRALAVNCPFTSEIAEFNIDLTLSQTQAYISVIQGVFVDNSDNADVVSITANGATNQTIDFPAGAQGYIPILATKPTSFNVSSAGAVTVPLIFLNVSVPAIIWGESSGGGGGGGGIIQIKNPGSQPAVASGATIDGVSDATGNLMVTINATQGGNSPYTTPGAAFPLRVDSTGQRLLVQAYVYNDEDPFFVYQKPYVQNGTYNYGRVAVTDAQTPIIAFDYWIDAGGVLKNAGSETVFIGFDTNLTAANGWPLEPNDTLDMSQIGAYGGAIYGICATGETSSIAYRGFA